MATLLINGTEHEAKFNFLFAKVAKEKYAETDENGKKGDGFSSVYMGLLQASNDSLVAFWDCGTAHLKGKDKPSVEDIQLAIAERAEEDGDTLGMLKEAYHAIDQSGFFKQQSKKLWSNFEMLKTLGATEEEKEKNKTMYETLIQSKKELTEREIIALENPRNAAEQEYLMQNVYNDVDVLVAGVRARIEQMRMEVLAKGTVTLAENGLNAVIDYGVPSGNKEVLAGASRWSDATSNPIEDIIRWSNKMDTTPTRILTSNTIVGKLLTHPEVKSAIFGTDTGRVLTVGELNNFLTGAQLPKLATYDAKYRKQAKSGAYTQHRYLPENAFVMFGEGTLGETLYGPTAEEIRLTRDPSIQTSKIGNVLAMVYEENLDPVSTWTKAVATAIPSFPAADEVFQAQPIA